MLMGITIKIHNTDIERELTDETSIWFYEKALKKAEESGKVLRAHLYKDNICYTIGEPNIDRLAKLLYEMLKEQGKM